MQFLKVPLGHTVQGSFPKYSELFLAVTKLCLDQKRGIKFIWCRIISQLYRK